MLRPWDILFQIHRPLRQPHSHQLLLYTVLFHKVDSFMVLSSWQPNMGM